MKRILAIFILLNTILFGKINDTLSLFNEEEKAGISTIITKMEENRGVTVYVNTYSGDEGFVVDKAQKVIVLNMIKIDDKNTKVELKFSKDMELDEETQGIIEELLNNNEKSILEKKHAIYTEEILIGVDSLMENIMIEEPIINENEKVEGEKKYFFIIMGLAFLLIFGIIIRVLRIKQKNSLNHRIDIKIGKK